MTMMNAKLKKKEKVLTEQEFRAAFQIALEKINERERNKRKTKPTIQSMFS